MAFFNLPTPANMNMPRDAGHWLQFLTTPQFKHMYRTKDMYKAEINEIKDILNQRTTRRRRPRLFHRHVVPPVPESPTYQTRRVKVSDVRVPFSAKVARRYKLRYSSLPTIQESPSS